MLLYDELHHRKHRGGFVYVPCAVRSIQQRQSRAHTENRSQNPSQSRHERRCDDTGDTSDQKHPKHQLRYLDMTDGGIRRSEIITVTIHYTIGVQPAGTSEIARSTTLRSVISERALIQILNRKQRLLLTALRMLFKKRFALRECSTACKSSACELANSAHAASKSSAFEEAPSPPFGEAFGRSSSALLLLRSVILITVNQADGHPLGGS